MDQEKFKTRPSSSLFQIARGSGATLRILEITKSVKTTVYTELFTWQRRKPDKNSTDQEKLSTQNNMQSCLHGKDESKTEYSASRTTLTTWTTHPKNKQGIQAEKASTKNLHSKKNITILL